LEYRIFIKKTNLKYLNDSKILKNNGYIYEFSNDIILNGLNSLLKERENTMDKDVSLIVKKEIPVQLLV
jgi:hypothetical protein